jgi:hypothetical protein
MAANDHRGDAEPQSKTGHTPDVGVVRGGHVVPTLAEGAEVTGVSERKRHSYKAHSKTRFSVTGAEDRPQGVPLRLAVNNHAS